ncbi:hypothetical protein ACFSL4_15700, partial [Streptomyces caeni]
APGRSAADGSSAVTAHDGTGPDGATAGSGPVPGFAWSSGSASDSRAVRVTGLAPADVISVPDPVQGAGSGVPAGAVTGPGSALAAGAAVVATAIPANAAGYSAFAFS